MTFISANDVAGRVSIHFIEIVNDAFAQLTNGVDDRALTEAKIKQFVSNRTVFPSSLAGPKSFGAFMGRIPIVVNCKFRNETMDVVAATQIVNHGLDLVEDRIAQVYRTLQKSADVLSRLTLSNRMWDNARGVYAKAIIAVLTGGKLKG